MSRIGKLPIPLPSGVTVTRKDDHQVHVKGPKGELTFALRPEVDVAVESGTLRVVQTEAGVEAARAANHGMTRAILASMVQGVTQGYEKKLEVVGVGWNASAQGNKVVLNIGFNKPVTVAMPAGVTVGTPSPTSIVLFGPDKQKVGHIAAAIRQRRPPEPYKGKGIRYEGEVVKRKAGKSFGATAT